jgi:hypothetical protein
MIIKRSKLLKALKLAMPGIETGNVTMEGADTFIFNKHFLQSYNGNIAVSVPFQIKNKKDEPVVGAVNAKDFYNVISKFKDDKIRIIPKSNVWIAKSSTASVEFTLIRNKTIDEILSGTNMKAMKRISPIGLINWQRISDNFIKALSICILPGNKSKMSGIFVIGNTMLSTDGVRVNQYVLASPMGPFFWITDKAANELMKLPITKYESTDPAWVHFSSDDGVTFSCKQLLRETFPRDRIANMCTVKYIFKNGDITNNIPEALLEAVNRASVLAQNIDSHETIKLTLDQKGIGVAAQRTSGKYYEFVPWEKPFVKGFTPISFFVDYAMITNVIKYSKSFYIKQIEEKGQILTRIIFVYTGGMQLIATFEEGK